MAEGVEITIDIPAILTGNTLATTILKSVEGSGMIVLDELCKWIQKSIKLRAPKGSSGYLRESIHAEPTGKNEMTIFGVDYAMYQNEGYEPHDVSVWWWSGGKPEYTIAKWLGDHGTEVNNIGASIKVSKFKQGFIDAGIEAGFENLDDIIEKVVAKKMRKDIEKTKGRVIYKR